MPNHIFGIRNKNLVLTLLTFPFSLLHISDVRASLLATVCLDKTINGLQRLQKHFAFLAISAACALMLVIMGPLFAVLHNQTLAILVVAAGLYPIVLIAGVFKVLRRRVFNQSKSAAWLQAAELVLCPILIINIGKKLGYNVQQR